MKKIIFLLIICLLGINLINTFSLFESEITTPVEIKVAGFNIKVNNNLIGEETKIIIDDVIWENNENIKDGKTAPGAIGYFDLEIIPEDVDVAFTYSFEIDSTEYENSNFKIESIEEDENVVKENEKKYSGVFTTDDIKNNKTHKVRFNLVWENDEEKNDLDSTYIGVSKQINIPITMSFSQLID